jgi:Signal peptidase, peptidase S26
MNESCRWMGQGSEIDLVRRLAARALDLKPRIAAIYRLVDGRRGIEAGCSTAYLDLNGYLPTGVPMLKRVLALPGQTVCRNGHTISVDGIEMGEARERDGRGRPLPFWEGCDVVEDGRLFLMNWQAADSFDGRYFGMTPATAVIGRVLPVWTWED